MSFPLRDWIDAHAGVPHNLALSGMGDQLQSVRRALRTVMAADPAALRAELARAVGVSRDRLFLTHGATEANTVVAFFLAHRLRSRGVGRPRARVPCPEYPPLSATAMLAGFRPARRGDRADLTLLSDPNNPTGEPVAPAARGAPGEGGGATLVDETFREFTSARSRARGNVPCLWTTGTFTKVYGGDGVRVGFVVAPGDEAEEFARFHGVLLDDLPDASVRAARALLRDRATITAEARSIFETNRRTLLAAHPEAVGLRAPVWFDRPPGWPDTEAFARALLDHGVLVCPGSYFGDPSGVRLCLTRRTFPADLARYDAVRDARAPARI